MPDAAALSKTLSQYRNVRLDKTLGLTEEELDLLTPAQTMSLIQYKSAQEQRAKANLKSEFEMQRKIPNIPVRASVLNSGLSKEEGKKIHYVTEDQLIQSGRYQPTELKLYRAYQQEQNSMGIPPEDQMTINEFRSADVSSMQEYTMYRYLARQKNIKNPMSAQEYKDFITSTGQARAGIGEKVATKEALDKVSMETDLKKQIVDLKSPSKYEAMVYKDEGLKEQMDESAMSYATSEMAKLAEKDPSINDRTKEKKDLRAGLQQAYLEEGRKKFLKDSRLKKLEELEGNLKYVQGLGK